MGETVKLGEITCPSGDLVILDGGCLGSWSEQSEFSGLDYHVTGPDAEVAAQSFQEYPFRYHYDIHANYASEWESDFAEHCRQHGLDAGLERLPAQVPHPERARHCAAEGWAGFQFAGMSAVAITAVPTDRPLPVLAERLESDDEDEWDGWRQMIVQIGSGEVALTRSLGIVSVDWARLTFADLAALQAWRHEEAIDGRADVLFWGLNAEQLAAELGVDTVDTPGDEGSYGWTNLPVDEAMEQAIKLQEHKDSGTPLRYAFDYRPHSHHWEVMGQVRASETDSGVITVGGAQILFTMTGWGDGFFPAHGDFDAHGNLLSVRVTLVSDE